MSSKKILVIDDDRILRAAIASNLRGCGYDVVEAENGVSCMTLLKNFPHPDLIITDILMPEKDGLEVVMEVREKHPAIKLVAISGGGRGSASNYLSLSKALGSDAILEKPLDMDLLITTVVASTTSEKGTAPFIGETHREFLSREA